MEVEREDGSADFDEWMNKEIARVSKYVQWVESIRPDEKEKETPEYNHKLAQYKMAECSIVDVADDWVNQPGAL